MPQVQAIVSNGQGHYQLTQIDVGLPAADEVQIRLKASGICHTDWDSIQHWNKHFVVGHEGAGIVSAVGEHVSRVEVGDHVILNWAIPCGQCFQCAEGNLHLCANHSPVCGCGLKGHAHAAACQHDTRPLERSFHLGTMSEMTVVKEAAVVKIPKEIPFPTAAIIGCGVMTGWGSVVNAAQLKAGSSACVIGCGGVGLNVIQASKVSGARMIIAIDITQERLDQATRFGATHGIIADKNDPDFQQVTAQVKQLTDGLGADYAFECTAIPALGAAPLALIRHAGTAVQVSGIEQRIEFDCQLFEWDKKYINPLYGMCNPQRDFSRILSQYQQGDLKLDELVSHTYSLSTLSQGFDDLIHGRIAKGVVVFD